MSISKFFADQVYDILSSLDLELNTIKEEPDEYYLFSNDVVSDDSFYRSLVEIVQEDKSANVIICCSKSIQENIPSVLELVNRLNAKTRQGAFIYNFEDGSIISQHSVYLTDDMNTFEHQLLHAIYLRFNLLDYYMPAFLAVSEGKDVVDVLAEMNHYMNDGGTVTN
jgi:hypothetical protein